MQRCGKCGATQSFTIYTRNHCSGLDSANMSYLSNGTIAALGTLGGLIFVAMFISLFWFIFFKRNSNYFKPAASTLSDTNSIEPPNNELLVTDI